MQKLIPILRDLVIAGQMPVLRISDFHFGHHQIYIKIERTSDLPSTNPFDYEVTIAMFNTLTAPPFKIPKVPTEELWNMELSKIFDGVKKIIPETHVLADDVRNAIIEAVKWLTTLDFEKHTKLIYSTALTDEENAALSKGRDDKQEDREQWYRTNYGLTNRQIGDLHSFHSPSQIPAGYSVEEVKLCIMLLPFRREHMKLSRNPFMPKHLSHKLFIKLDEPISRTELLKDAIFEMFMDLNRQPPPICES